MNVWPSFIILSLPDMNVWPSFIILSLPDMNVWPSFIIQSLPDMNVWPSFIIQSLPDKVDGHKLWYWRILGRLDNIKISNTSPISFK